MEEKKRLQISIQSYQSVYNFEKRVYSFLNVVLPVSISYSDLAYFAVTELIMQLFNSVIGRPPFVPPGVWWMLAFVGMPALVTRYGRQLRLDGKGTAVFFMDWIEYLFDRRKTFEGLRQIDPADEAMEGGKARWRCTYKSY